MAAPGGGSMGHPKKNKIQFMSKPSKGKENHKLILDEVLTGYPDPCA